MTTGERFDASDLLQGYGALLREVDQWFASCMNLHGDLIACRSGCSACCRGIFDITLLDALYLKQGLDRLPPAGLARVASDSRARLASLSLLTPLFAEPWILNTIPEQDWDEIMPEDDETPCVLLGGDGTCLAYGHRPMTCRLNGIPLIDTGGEELFDDWCTLNFTGCDPRGMEGLRHPFNELFAQELLLFRELTRRLLGKPVSELDTIIPAAVFMDREMLGKIAVRAFVL